MGGGYRPPNERPIEDVVRDVQYCFLASDEALRIYGVDTSTATRVEPSESGPDAPLPDGGTRQPDWIERVGGRRSIPPEAVDAALGAWHEARL